MGSPLLERTLLASAAVALLALTAAAQIRVPPAIDPASVPDQKVRPLGDPAAELIKRAEIKHEEESHKEMVERADEAARLGLDLREAFGRQKSLGREDLKRLERLEKLARKIRGNVGGSDDEEQLEDPPPQLEQAVARLAEVSEKLCDGVRKTSRHVVSGAVIERSNELLQLIRHIRAFAKP